MLAFAVTAAAQTRVPTAPPTVADPIASPDVTLADLRRDHEATIAAIEAARHSNRKRERSTAAGDEAAALAGWADTAPARAALQRHIARHLDTFDRALALLDATERPGTARQCGELLQNAIRVGEPGVILDHLRQCTRLAGTLAFVDATTRRDCLHAVAVRLHATPGTSDLDVLTAVCAWSEPFLARVPPGKPLLDALSTDLVLLFTERAPDGIKLSRTTYYRPGDFESRGFRAELRDDSNQVRHFCWALRILARAPTLAGARHLLELKEASDALRRGLPVSEIDLRLNAVTERFAELALGYESAPPLAIGAYATALRRALGE